VNPSSPVRVPTDHRVEARPHPTPGQSREYRSRHQHLYPFEDFETALVDGGTVRSFCGIDTALTRGGATEPVEVTKPDADDCITCVDTWLGRRLVRL
jgi:hypothetical protein